MREIKREFRHAIKCGLGSTYFIMRDNPGIDFSHDIIKASLSNLAIDPQCEGDRAVYLAKLIDISRKKEAIIARILTGLAAAQNDTWALDQLFELAAIFTLNENKNARHAIYKKFRDTKIKDSTWCGEEAILKVDGIKGLIFIAKTRGKELLKDAEDCEDSFRVNQFQKDNPQINVYATLEKAAVENKFVRQYLDTIQKYTLPPRRKRKYTYSKVKANIEKLAMFPVTPSGIKDLTIADIKKLADDFQRESNPRKQEKYLRVFAKVKFPYNYKVILNIAKSQDNGKNKLIEPACKALSLFKSDKIRQFALDKLQATANPSDYLPFLVSNYKKGDEVILTEIASRYTDYEYIHLLVGGYIAIYGQNKTKACKAPLEILYQKMNCGIHRADIVQILYDNNVLSPKILSELEYDSFDETRQFYENITKKVPMDNA